MKGKNLKKALAVTLACSMATGNISMPQKALAAGDARAEDGADISSGLVGYYAFEDSLENGASTTGGKAKLHGGAGDTWNNLATGTENYEDSKAGFGRAYHFLGDTTAGRGEGLQLDAKVTGTEYTVSFWVNPEKYESNYTSLLFANHGDSCFSVNSVDGYRCSTVFGKLWDNCIRLDGDNTDGGKASVGSWTMVTITCKSGEQKLYFDGQEKASASSANTNVIETLKDQDIFLGINWWDPSFAGLMDEVRIYDRVLTSADIAKLYTTTSIPVTGIQIDKTGSGKITTSIVYETEADKNAGNKASVNYGTYKCSADLIPGYATDQGFTWSVESSTTADEATISNDGLVTLNEKAQDGDEITVRAVVDSDNSLYDDYTLTVVVNEIISDNVKEITDENVGNYYQEVNKDRVSVHDPAIIKDKDGTYYIFGSHLAWAKSKDLVTWETFTNNITTDYETLFKNEIKWASAGDKVYNPSGNIWAPDVIWNKEMGKWCMYMSINGCSWNSCICLLTADSLSGDWTYIGPVVYSGFTASGTHDFNNTDYKDVTGSSELDAKFITNAYSEKDNGTACEATTWNKKYGAHAIDACVFYDESGKLWFTYGSWSGGIYMFELDETTGFRKNTAGAKQNYTDAYMGKKLGGSSASGEASYIEYINGYYYLFISYGGLVANGGYNMRVFRSENPDGPYSDVSGDPALNGGAVNGKIGTRLMSYYKWSWWDYAHVAQGHNSAFVDDGKAYLIYHTRTDDGTEGHSVRVHQLFTTENGYLVAAPFEYSTTDNVAAGYAADVIAGTYEVLFQENTNNTTLEYNKPQVITLNKDGTIEGSKTGTWEIKADSPLVSLTIDKIVYEGTFVEQNMEGTNVKTLCFTTVGTNDICLWGAKYPDDRTAVAWASSDITIPAVTYSDLELPVKGQFGTEITWQSDNTEVLGNDGSVKGIAGTAKLTATIRKGECFRVMEWEVTVKPKDASGRTLVAEYFTDNAADLTTGIKEGTYRYDNPFNQANISGLDIDNGVAVSFDYERNGADIAKLGAIFSFKVKADSNPKMFLTDGTYLGYNAWDGNFFDANNDYDTMRDFIGTGKKHVELVIEPTGFTLNVDGAKAYDIKDFNEGTISKNINDTGTVNYSSMLKWLNETADELNFGWGSFWTADADAVKAKISNVKFYVLPGENIDLSDYVYYENYNKVYDASEKWTVERAGASIGNNNDNHRNYINIAMDASVSANGSAATDFGSNAAEPDNYVIELDTALRSGNVAQRSMSEFVIAGTDCNAKVQTNAESAVSGYILKLATKALEGDAGKGTSNTEDWYINDSEEKVTLPLLDREPQWVHIKAEVNRTSGKAVVTITSGDTELYSGEVDINGTGALKGLYAMIGRGNGLVKVDNIAVYKQEQLESISLNYEKLEIATGASQTLIVSKKPSFAGTGTVSWESADTSIATVDENGKVTGVSNGTTTVTATLDGKTASCTVVVGSQTPSQSPAASQSPAESQSPAASQNPAESQSPAVSQNPAESQSPAESQNPATSQNPAVSQNPAESQSPAESQNPATSQSPLPSQNPEPEITYKVSYIAEENTCENVVILLDKEEVAEGGTANLTIKPNAGYEFKSIADISVAKVTGNCTIGSGIKNIDGSYTYQISNISGDCQVVVSAVATIASYTVTYNKDAISNALIEVTYEDKEDKEFKEFPSGSVVGIDDKLRLVIKPVSNEYTFASAPVAWIGNPDNAILGEAEIKDGAYTYIIHTFSGAADINISGSVEEVVHNVTISQDAYAALRNATAELSASGVTENSVIKLTIIPKKGYRVKKAGDITTEGNTCKVLSSVKGANSTWVITLSGFTGGDTVITGIPAIVDKTVVSERGTDIGTNIGAADLSETDFADKDTGGAITKAIIDTSKIKAVIDTITNDITSAAEKIQEAVGAITDALKEEKDVSVSLEVKKETNLNKEYEDVVKEIPEKDIREKVLKNAGGEIKTEIAMPLDISLYAQVTGTGYKVSLKDTDKEMSIKLQIPSNIPKVANGAKRSYYVVRFHEGKEEIIPCGYGKTSDTLVFRSNKFSTYVLCYVDVTEKRLNTIIGGNVNVSTPVPSKTPEPVADASPSQTPSDAPAASVKPVPSETPAIAVQVTQTPGVTDSVPVASPDSKPQVTPGTDDGVGNTSSVRVKTGDRFTIKNIVYKVTSDDDTKAVQFIKVKKSLKKIVIPPTVKIKGDKYKVKSIAAGALKNNTKVTSLEIGSNIRKIKKNAFKGCKKLKKITIKSVYLTSKTVGKDAFKGISKNAIIKVPKGKARSYKKIIKAKGAGNNIKVKKK